MKSTRYDCFAIRSLGRQVQMERVRTVIREELTALQREAIIAYYFQEQSIPQIARDRGVNKSTVSRTLRRAEEKLRRFLKY